ncbi:ankyrin repeat domain-containing protein 60 [Hyla sarda]|uniref:ankyrin repeat domain-containing protein 60 n=1 Tax=Hyla sarda TaxID=327740 RepID=UPI0024C43ABC|nr:ankyrin repeat domain-containing protein 60 [Hyla sarda]
MASRGKVKSSHPGTPNDGRLSVKVRLLETGENFSVTGCSQRTEIGKLKEKLELVAGIPKKLQSLSYLDDGDMPDKSTLEFNGIIPGGKLSLRVWPYEGMSDLITFAATGDLLKLKTVGITPDSSFNTANSLRFNAEQKKEWLASRAGLALYVAAHRGHLHVMRFLLRNGCNVQWKTCLGNSGLHVAAAMGNFDCVNELLANGARTQDTNEKGQTALDVSQLWGQKKVARRLFLFFWEERTANVKVKTHLDPSELFAHQRHDSKLKTWWKGSYATHYMANLTQFSDFHGSHFGATPKKAPVKRIQKKANA